MILKRYQCGADFLFLACLYNSKPVEWLGKLINSLFSIIAWCCGAKSFWQVHLFLEQIQLHDCKILSSLILLQTSNKILRKVLLAVDSCRDSSTCPIICPPYLEKRPFPKSNMAMQKYVVCRCTLHYIRKLYGISSQLRCSLPGRVEKLLHLKSRFVWLHYIGWKSKSNTSLSQVLPNGWDF